MANKYKNKKTNVTYILAIILITVISFFLYLNFFVLNTKNVSENSQDMLCRSLIAGKDLSVVKLAEFFYQINYRCHKDFIKDNDVKSKEEVFEILSESQKRCWYRYGEGKYDFMTDLNKDGYWCFECGQIDFSDSKLTEVYTYNEYMEFLKEKKITIEEEEKTYYTYLNLKHAEQLDSDELASIKTEIEELLEDSDYSNKAMAYVYNEQYNLLTELYKKKIDTTQKIYVVYRYDKVPEDFTQKITDATYTSLGVTAGVVIGGLALEKGLMILASCGGAALTGGALAPLCGGAIVATVVSGIKTTAKVTKKSYDLLKKSAKIGEYLKNGVKISKRTKNSITFFSGHVDDLIKIGNDLKNIDPKLSSQILEFSTKLKSKGINHIDEIDSGLIISNQKIKEIDDLYKGSQNVVNNIIFDKPVLIRQREELSKLKDEIIEIEKSLSTLPDADKTKLIEKKSTYIKGTIALTAGVAAGSIAYNMNENENQYVDLLTEEQYYRLCGTRSYSDGEK